MEEGKLPPSAFTPAMKESGVTTLNVTPIGSDHAARLKLIEKVKELAESV